MKNTPPEPVVHLRPFERRDYARLLRAMTSPEALMQWAGPLFDFPLDEPQLEAYRLSVDRQPGLRRIWTACTPDEAPVGHIELNEIDGHAARLCRVLIEPSQRRRGLGRAMVRQALQVGFGDLGLHRIELLVFDFNDAAIRCCERVGFVREGHLREARSIGGRFWSLDCMAILEPEWRALVESKSGSAVGGAA